MPFSPRIKHTAKMKAAFRCCVCQKPFVEVHHLVPQSEGGSDALENAAPLCASCHDLYGGNPEKRNALTQTRDYWWDLMEQKQKFITDPSEINPAFEIDNDPNHQGSSLNSRSFIYHRVFHYENFETSIPTLVGLIHSSQERLPGRRRLLFLDIEGHKKEMGNSTMV